MGNEFFSRRRAWLGGCVLLWLSGAGIGLQAQGTAFTYQGRLLAGGVPANGSYDLRLAVYGSPSGADLVAGPMTNAAVTVSNGLFTTVLDFGLGTFTGPARWLAIGVSTNGSGSFFDLSPRQPLTPAPYAITAGTVVGGSGAGLTNVNAASLGGVDASAYALTNHTHYGQNWSGAASTGLTLSTTASTPGAVALHVISGAPSGFSPAVPFALWADSGPNTAIQGSSTSGAGMIGSSSSAMGLLGIGIPGLQGQSTVTAVYGLTLGTSGTGVVAYAAAQSGNTFGLVGRSDSPSGQGVYGVATAGTGSGYGVVGEAASTNGAGVWAKGGGTNGSALKISNGSLRVEGAGLQTATPAFIHRATGTNITSDYTVIDNPFCNNDPNALLLVTPNWSAPGGPSVYNTHLPGVFYTGTRWAIFNQDTTPMLTNAAFNVLVIKP